MARKGVLGKGLNALLPDEEGESGPRSEGSGDDESSGRRLSRFQDSERLGGRVAELPVNRIEPNPYQPRQDFDEQALDELADSIRQFGLIQPITVRVAEDGENFEVISGERRLRAARRAELDRVPAFVRTAENPQMLEMALVENVQREDLNPVEVALGYRRLIDECGLTHDEVAERVGRNRSTVSNLLRLLRLPAPVQLALREHRISTGHARPLVNLEDEETQVDLLETILEEELTVRDVEKRVRELQQEPDEEASSDDSEAEASAEAAEPPADRDSLQIEATREQLRRCFGTQVRIHHQNDGTGKIEVAYYGPEDLERLVDLMLEQ